MYAHLDGIVAEKTTDGLVIDVGGVGYLLNVSQQTMARAPQAGSRMKVYTYLSVREDAMELFGFADREEKKMFEKLKAVSGIGPKTALQILSTLTVRDISVAILTGDAGQLSRAPGIGKKTAQRLVLELKDKVDQNELTMGVNDAPLSLPKTSVSEEAIEALIALGYQPQEATRAIARVQDQSTKTDELIRLALKGML